MQKPYIFLNKSFAMIKGGVQKGYTLFLYGIGYVVFGAKGVIEVKRTMGELVSHNTEVGVAINETTLALKGHKTRYSGFAIHVVNEKEVKSIVVECATEVVGIGVDYQFLVVVVGFISRTAAVGHCAVGDGNRKGIAQAHAPTGDGLSVDGIEGLLKSCFIA